MPEVIEPRGAGEGAQPARTWRQRDGRMSSVFETDLKWTDVKDAAEHCPLALPRISALMFPIMQGHVNRHNYGMINNVGHVRRCMLAPA